jgi:hypothetical protein
MKTNLTLAMILSVLFSACAANPPAQPTIAAPASQTLASETAAPTANPPTPAPPPTATVLPTYTPTPTHTPLPALLPNAIDLQWITAYGLPGVQSVTNIHATRDGGFVLVGNRVVNDRYSAVLLKLRADGLIVWQQYLPQVRALEVLETSTGEIILAGDMHWIKFDSQGILLWQHTFDQPPYHIGPILRLVEESDGNIVVEAAGSRTVFSADGEQQSLTESVTSDSQMSPQEAIDRFDLDENQFDYVGFVQTTADGGAIVGTYIYRDVGLVADLEFQVVIFRFSGDGAMLWQRAYGGYFSASYEDVHIFETKSGDILVAGTLIYFANQEYRNDVWVLRLDSDGNSVWDKLFATEGQDPEGLDVVTVIRELSNGDLIFAGQTSGAGTGSQDMWVIKTNAQGEIPNCGLVFDGSAGSFGSFPEVETTTLEDGQWLNDPANAQIIPLCSPSP